MSRWYGNYIQYEILYVISYPYLELTGDYLNCRWRWATWISNYIQQKIMVVITHACSNPSLGLLVKTSSFHNTKPQAWKTITKHSGLQKWYVSRFLWENGIRMQMLPNMIIFHKTTIRICAQICLLILLVLSDQKYLHTIGVILPQSTLFLYICYVGNVTFVWQVGWR